MKRALAARIPLGSSGWTVDDGAQVTIYDPWKMCDLETVTVPSAAECGGTSLSHRLNGALHLLGYQATYQTSGDEYPSPGDFIHFAVERR